MNKERFPRWLSLSWWIIYPLVTVFIGRLLYERIYLAPKYGNLLGFEFVHLYPAIFFPSVLGFFLAHAWLIAALVFIIWKRAQVSNIEWLKVTLVVLTLGIDYLPVEKLFGLS